MLAWISEQLERRQVAVEGARGYGWALTLRLLEICEVVIDVPAQLTADGRRTTASRGKDDVSDAAIVARVALRKPGLQRPAPKRLDTDLKFLVDARDQLVAEAGRVRNRLHAILLAIAAGYRNHTGALRSGRSGGRETQHLESVCGVGTLVAGKLLGEIQHIDRFPTAAALAVHGGVAPVPASSGTRERHRLNRGGNRQLNRALYTVARTQARWHPLAQAYLARKRSEGKSPAEAGRCVMRHLATAVWKAMRADAAVPQDQLAEHAVLT